MAKYTITLIENEEKALSTDINNINEWIQNAIKEKTRRCIDQIVKEYSDKNPDKINMTEKLEIVKNAKIKEK